MIFSKEVTECIQVYRLVKDSFVESCDTKCIMHMCITARSSYYARVNTNNIINLMIKLTVKVCANDEDTIDIQ